jgi:hypothetical protein
MTNTKKERNALKKRKSREQKKKICRVKQIDFAREMSSAVKQVKIDLEKSFHDAVALLEGIEQIAHIAKYVGSFAITARTNVYRHEGNFVDGKYVPGAIILDMTNDKDIVAMDKDTFDKTSSLVKEVFDDHVAIVKNYKELLVKKNKIWKSKDYQVIMEFVTEEVVKFLISTQEKMANIRQNVAESITLVLPFLERIKNRHENFTTLLEIMNTYMEILSAKDTDNEDAPSDIPEYTHNENDVIPIIDTAQLSE